MTPWPLLASHLVGSDASAATTDAAVWTSATLQADLDAAEDTGPRVWADLHFRRADANFAGVVRPALAWDLVRGVSLFAGYAWIPSFGESTDDQLSNEHRAWQQVLLQRSLGRSTVALRPRFEQRSLVGNPEVALRARLWGRASAPLSERVALVVSDEVFVGVAETAWSVGGFDQNRVFVGPALRLEEVGRVEFGYLNTFLPRDEGNTILHVAAVNLFFNL